MTVSNTQNRWFEKLINQLLSLSGVERQNREDGEVILSLNYNGKFAEIIITPSISEIRDQKSQYQEIRNTLTQLGVIEGQNFVPPKRTRNPMTPQMIALRAAQQKEFNAWQQVWKIVRLAEMSLDREYELSIMKDYY